MWMARIASTLLHWTSWTSWLKSKSTWVEWYSLLACLGVYLLGACSCGLSACFDGCRKCSCSITEHVFVPNCLSDEVSSHSWHARMDGAGDSLTEVWLRGCISLHCFHLQEVAIKALRKYGVGSCGPRGFYGTIGGQFYPVISVLFSFISESLNRESTRFGLENVWAKALFINIQVQIQHLFVCVSPVAARHALGTWEAHRGVHAHRRCNHLLLWLFNSIHPPAGLLKACRHHFLVSWDLASIAAVCWNEQW